MTEITNPTFFDKPFKVALDWYKWRVKQKSGIRTQMWYADGPKRAIGSEADILI